MNAGIARLAVQYHLTLVDLYSHGSQLTAHPEYINGDDFHPRVAGYYGQVRKNRAHFYALLQGS